MEKKYSWTEGTVQYDLMDQSNSETQECLCSSRYCCQYFETFFSLILSLSLPSCVNPVHSNAFKFQYIKSRRLGDKIVCYFSNHLWFRLPKKECGMYMGCAECMMYPDVPKIIYILRDYYGGCFHSLLINCKILKWMYEKKNNE